MHIDVTVWVLASISLDIKIMMIMLMMMSISHLVMEAPKKLATMPTPSKTMVRVNLKVVRDTFLTERMISDHFVIERIITF